jgi:hypothetical protein
MQTQPYGESFLERVPLAAVPKNERPTLPPPLRDRLARFERAPVVLALGAASLAVGALAGRLGLHFGGLLTVRYVDGTTSLPWARTALENVLAWPLPAVTWWLALAPFARVRLAPLLASTAVAHVLLALVGLFGRFANLDAPAANPQDATIFVVSALAALAMIGVLVYLAMRRAAPRRPAWFGYLFAATVVATEVTSFALVRG